MSTQFLIKNCRLGYPNVWEPKVVVQNGRPLADSKPRFSCNLHLPPGAQHQVKKAIKEAIETKWPDPKKRPFVSATEDPMTWYNKNHQTGQKSSGLRLPLVWGPAEWPDDPNATGWVLITSSPENSPPAVVEQRNGMNVAVTEHAKVYPGAEAHAYVGIYGYSVGQDGVACGLNGLLLTGREMGRFDSKPTIDQMFADVTTDDMPNDDPFGDAGGTAVEDDIPY